MKLGIMGRLFPAAFGKTVYDYTARAVPDIDIREFKKKHMREYKGGKLLRTKTLGAGDDCCDFHVVKKA